MIISHHFVQINCVHTIHSTELKYKKKKTKIIILLAEGGNNTRTMSFALVELTECTIILFLLAEYCLSTTICVCCYYELSFPRAHAMCICVCAYTFAVVLLDCYEHFLFRLHTLALVLIRRCTVNIWVCLYFHHCHSWQRMSERTPRVFSLGVCVCVVLLVRLAGWLDLCDVGRARLVWLIAMLLRCLLLHVHIFECYVRRHTAKLKLVNVLTVFLCVTSVYGGFSHTTVF